MAMTVKLAPVAREHRRSSKRHKSGWKDRLQSLINEHAYKDVHGRVASPRTIAITAESLFKAFKTLYSELDMKPQPRNLKEKHVRRLVQYWYHTEKKPVAHIKADLLILREFEQWIRKPSMVKDLEVYLTELASPVAACESIGEDLIGTRVESRIADSPTEEALFTTLRANGSQAR